MGNRISFINLPNSHLQTELIKLALDIFDDLRLEYLTFLENFLPGSSISSCYHTQTFLKFGFICPKGVYPQYGSWKS